MAKNNLLNPDSTEEGKGAKEQKDIFPCVQALTCPVQTVTETIAIRKPPLSGGGVGGGTSNRIADTLNMTTVYVVRRHFQQCLQVPTSWLNCIFLQGFSLTKIIFLVEGESNIYIL